LLGNDFSKLRLTGALVSLSALEQKNGGRDQPAGGDQEDSGLPRAAVETPANFRCHTGRPSQFLTYIPSYSRFKLVEKVNVCKLLVFLPLLFPQGASINAIYFLHCRISRRPGNAGVLAGSSFD
jgi:hypothetical protein